MKFYFTNEDNCSYYQQQVIIPLRRLQGYIVILMSVRPSPSLIRYSSKTAEQNFMKLSGFIHYMVPYCTFFYKISFE